MGKVLYFKVRKLLTDESGLNFIWSSKGAGGTKPCFTCSNVLGLEDDDITLITEDRTGQLVDIRCCDPARFCLLENRDWFRNADLLSSIRPHVGIWEVPRCRAGRWIELGRAWLIIRRGLTASA